MLETAWESRWLPDLIKKDKIYHRFEIKSHFGFKWLVNISTKYMYLENFILNDTINNNLTVRSSSKEEWKTRKTSEVIKII